MHGTPGSSQRGRRSGFALVALSLVAIAFLTLRPAHASSFRLQSHLCVVCGDLAGVDIILNTLLFVPLGVGLSLIGWSARKAVLACFALSLSIETAQLFIAHGRDATLSDLLANTFGGAIGFWLARTVPVWVAPSRKSAGWLTVMWAAVWLLIQIVSNYAFFPSLTSSQYHGHVARQSGRMSMFHGDVDSARIGTTPFPDTIFEDSRPIRQLLLQGAPIVASVRLSEPTPNFAAIIGVGDNKQREITLLAEEGDRLVYSIRTGASKLRLRQPLFAMRDVFGARARADSAADTLVLSGRFNHGTAQIAAETHSARGEINLSPRAALAWTVVLPFQWYLEDREIERVVTFLWMSVLLVPLGFWVATFARQSSATAGFVVSAVVVAIIVAGLALLPVAFSLTPATFLDWIAALVGLCFGAALALRLNHRIAARVGPR